MTRLRRFRRHSHPVDTAGIFTAIQAAALAHRVTQLEAKVGAIHHETQPNDGDSMKDQLDRVDRALRSGSEPAADDAPTVFPGQYVARPVGATNAQWRQLITDLYERDILRARMRSAQGGTS
jgi:hypothetical protein